MKYSRLILMLCLSAACLFTVVKLAQTKVSTASRRQDSSQAIPIVFSNTAPIAINDATLASPYPSAISVAGIQGAILNTPGSVKVTLNNFSHSFPDDVGIVLVGPTGAALLLQDGAGDADDMVNVTYTLSDSGMSTLPDSTAWGPGVFKPTNYYFNGAFPAPGPGSMYKSPGPAGGGTATFGTIFGGTNPNGIWNLYVFDFASPDVGSVTGGWSLEINSSTPPASGGGKFTAYLSGPNEVPANNSPGTGFCVVTLNGDETEINVLCDYTGLSGDLLANHIHANAPPGTNAGILFNLDATGGTSGTFTAGPFPVTPIQVANMRAQLWYINLHTAMFPGGEIRGQVKKPNTVFDFDGDGRTDITVFRQSTNTFYTLQSLTNTFQATSFGSGAGDIWLNLTCDFDGDGRGDPLLLKFDAGNILNWSILQTGSNTIRNLQWGDFSPNVGDTLAISDYDGDGKQDIAVYRRLNGLWSIIQSSNGEQRFEVWGATAASPSQGDQPAVGDYDGDGKADLTVVRTESGQRVWYIRQSATGTLRTAVWGLSASDGFLFFAPFDVDGDGKQDIAINRAVSGQRVYYILRSSDEQLQVVTWGSAAGAPAAVNLLGDYDGDGKTDFVSRQLIGGQMIWNILLSTTQAHRSVQWGMSGDQ